MSEEEQKDINNLIYTLEMHHISSKPIQDLLDLYNKEKEKKDNKIASKDKEIKLLKEFHNKHIKIIDEMAEEIAERTGSCPFDTYEYEMENCKDCQDSYKKCWIEYFTNKVEGEN